MALSTYPDVVKDISAHIGTLNTDIPETMKGFSAMAQAAAGSDGALKQREKELIAMGIAVALRCDGCIGFHTKALVKLGVTRAEFEEMLGVTVYMGGGPSLMYAAQALRAWEEFGGEKG
jgi:AhpD family alkylhydroperoxidase